MKDEMMVIEASGKGIQDDATHCAMQSEADILSQQKFEAKLQEMEAELLLEQPEHWAEKQGGAWEEEGHNEGEEEDEGTYKELEDHFPRMSWRRRAMEEVDPNYNREEEELRELTPLVMIAALCCMY